MVDSPLAQAEALILALEDEDSAYRARMVTEENRGLAIERENEALRKERDGLKAALEKADALADHMMRECECCGTPCTAYVLARMYKEVRHAR